MKSLLSSQCKLSANWIKPTCSFAAGFPTGPDEAVAHAGPEQWNQATRYARLWGWLQQVCKCLVSSDLFVGVTSAGISGTLLWYIVGNIPHLPQSDKKLPLCLHCSFSIAVIQKDVKFRLVYFTGNQRKLCCYPSCRHECRQWWNEEMIDQVIKWSTRDHLKLVKWSKSFSKEILDFFVHICLKGRLLLLMFLSIVNARINCIH